LTSLNTAEPAEIMKRFGVRVIDRREYAGQGQWMDSPAAINAAREEVLRKVRYQISVRHAKAKAEEIGLKVWQWLILEKKVDPKALLSAQGVAERVTGVEDAVISGDTIADCWFAAGCRDTTKFRLLIRMAMERENKIFNYRLKGLSVNKIVLLSRGLKATERSPLQPMFSAKALISIGKLDWIARRAVQDDLEQTVKEKIEATAPASQYRVRIRVRDLNWSAVVSLQTTAREEVAAKYLKGTEALRYLGKYPEDPLASAPRWVREWLSQAKPATKEDLVRAEWSDEEVATWETTQLLLAGFQKLGLKTVMNLWHTSEPSCGIDRRLAAFKVKIAKRFGEAAANLLATSAIRHRRCGMGISASGTDSGIERRIRALCRGELNQTMVLPNGQIIIRYPAGLLAQDHHFYRSALALPKEGYRLGGDATMVAIYTVFGFNCGRYHLDGSGDLAKSLRLGFVDSNLVAFATNGSVEWTEPK
jgi:hypothetical protein